MAGQRNASSLFALNSWHSIDVTLSGLKGTTIVNGSSNPNDFNERYTTTFNDSQYSAMHF